MYYDCIYDENADLNTLLKDWLCLDEAGFYYGPCKLNIRDKELFDKFLKDFNEIKNCCPKLTSLNDLWAVYVDGVRIHDNTPKCFMDALTEIIENENC